MNSAPFGREVKSLLLPPEPDFGGFSGFLWNLQVISGRLDGPSG
jgi:hypothetical protein